MIYWITTVWSSVLLLRILSTHTHTHTHSQEGLQIWDWISREMLTGQLVSGNACCKDKESCGNLWGASQRHTWQRQGARLLKDLREEVQAGRFSSAGGDLRKGYLPEVHLGIKRRENCRTSLSVLSGNQTKSTIFLKCSF